jgi:hypothetical protein
VSKSRFHSFNTSRKYTKNGQQINWTLIGKPDLKEPSDWIEPRDEFSRHVYFHDLDRGIEGSTQVYVEDLFGCASLKSEIEEILLRAYDAGNYNRTVSSLNYDLRVQVKNYEN